MIADSLPSLGAWPLFRISRHLIAGDNPADDRIMPVIIRGNQSSSAVMQLQCRISQCIGNTIVSKLWANGAHNHSLWFSPLNNEPANHHVVTRLHKAASTNIA